MLHEPTLEKLYAMRLASMADAWQQQSKDATISSLAFDERFALLVDAEHISRDNRRLNRLLKDAALRIPGACVEDIDVSAGRGIDKAMVRQLASCSWVHDHLNVLLCGPTGVGKSYVACALGQSACRKGHRVAYRRVPRLLDELALARAEGTYARLLGRLAKADVVLLDDWGLGTLKENSAMTFSRFSRIVTAARRRSSPASCRSRNGMNGSETRASPTPSWTASSTTRTSSTSRATRDEGRRPLPRAELLTCLRRFAPFTMPETRDHDAAIWLLTMGDTRSVDSVGVHLSIGGIDGVEDGPLTGKLVDSFLDGLEIGGASSQLDDPVCETQIRRCASGAGDGSLPDCSMKRSAGRSAISTIGDSLARELMTGDVPVCWEAASALRQTLP